MVEVLSCRPDWYDQWHNYMKGNRYCLRGFSPTDSPADAIVSVRRPFPGPALS